MSKDQQVPTLYEWIGGIEQLEKLTTVFYDKVLADELLEPVFRHVSPEHRRHVAQFIAEVFKGPPFYTVDRGGSHAGMVAHHVNKRLSEAQRQRWVSLMLATADEIGVPNDPEFRSALVAYLEWGSRIAVINSQLSENPLDEATPMPNWGWGETGGPYIPGNA